MTCFAVRRSREGSGGNAGAEEAARRRDSAEERGEERKGCEVGRQKCRDGEGRSVEDVGGSWRCVEADGSRRHAVPFFGNQSSCKRRG